MRICRGSVGRKTWFRHTCEEPAGVPARSPGFRPGPERSSGPGPAFGTSRAFRNDRSCGGEPIGQMSPTTSTNEKRKDVEDIAGTEDDEEASHVYAAERAAARFAQDSCGYGQVCASGRRAGSGAFGVVYVVKVRSPCSKSLVVAVKIEKPKPKIPMVEFESLVYNYYAVLLPQNGALSRFARYYDWSSHTTIGGRSFSNKDKCKCLVMEWIPLSLHQAITPNETGHVLVKLGQLAAAVVIALKAIHSKGFVHCDVKPENIRVRRDGSVCLVDFGLALKHRDRLTRGLLFTCKGGENLFCGTPRYMSVNVHAGCTPIERDDLESLGYGLAELCGMTLPWKHLDRQKPHIPHAEFVAIKRAFRPRVASPTIDVDRYLEICQKWGYGDPVNYSALRACFWPSPSHHAA